MTRLRVGRAVVDGEPRLVAGVDAGVYLAPGSVDMLDVISDWATWRPRLEALAGGAGEPVDPEQLTWLPPVMPEKLICVGTNYRDHIAEMEGAGGPPGPENPWPYGFLKPARTALVGHGATVTLPGYSRKVDWECELAVVIGDGTKAAGDDPLQAVFGYSVLNDLSARDYVPPPHPVGLDTITAKGFDGSAPMGPWIVPASEIDDPQGLALRLSVNGALKQNSTTAHMIFGVREIVAHFARILTLVPGDVISTGTPGGVGIAQRPPESLSAGDVVEAEIEPIGRLRTTFAPAPVAPAL